jgi:hypothetical protein
MSTYLILSRFSPEAFKDPKEFRDLANAVSAKIKKQPKWSQHKHRFGRLKNIWGTALLRRALNGAARFGGTVLELVGPLSQPSLNLGPSILGSPHAHHTFNMAARQSQFLLVAAAYHAK